MIKHEKITGWSCACAFSRVCDNLEPFTMERVEKMLEYRQVRTPQEV